MFELCVHCVDFAFLGVLIVGVWCVVNYVMVVCVLIHVCVMCFLYVYPFCQMCGWCMMLCVWWLASDQYSL